MESSEAIEFNTDQSQELYRVARHIIPGATQLLSKRPELFAPNLWPAYYRSASSCFIVDLDDNRFLDMSTMGIGACLLGYADDDVTSAVVERVRAGSMCSLNAPEEVQLAQRLIELHCWADSVRFARTGGEAMSIAVRIARASSGRDCVAFCGYHGWHDWYLAANRASSDNDDPLRGHLLPGLAPNGVPSQLAGTAFPFNYNRIDELAALVNRYGDKLAAVVMEPTRTTHPEPHFLEGVRELCEQCGAVLIFDEITTGWRFANGGVHLNYGISPDIAVFAKALANGHPMAAIVGRSSVMHAAQDSFISSTYWTEGVGPTAALATLAKMKAVDVPAHINEIGCALREGIEELGRKHCVPIRTQGHPALTSIAFEHEDAAALQTLFTIRMLSHGILSGSLFYPSFAHRHEHVSTYLSAADEVLPELAQAIVNGDAVNRVHGHVKHTGFKRLT